MTLLSHQRVPTLSDAERAGRTAGQTHQPATIGELEPGAHICSLYETEEDHRAVLTPFLRQGLERGEKVLYIVDSHTAEAILGYLREDGLDVELYLARGQLAILTRDDAYMQQGLFDPDGMIALLRAETERALAEGYPALRVTGEMTWALRGLPGSGRLIEYEARLNEFFPGSKCLAICQYDRRAFSSALLLDVLCTHPVAIVGTAVYDNFYYIPPADFLSDDPPAAHFRHRVEQLAERKRAQEALRRQEHELAERVKELNGLYGISVLVDKPGISLQEILQGTADLLPPCWQYPEATCARIIVDGQEFRTANFKETTWRQASNIRAGDQRAGSVEVYYLDKRPESDEGPFLKAERTLINAVGERLGHITERKRAQQALRESESKYRTLVENLPQKVFFKDRNSVYVSCNENYARDLRINPDEIVGKTDCDFYPKELAERYRADDKRIMESGETEDLEEEYLQDGRKAYVHTVKTPARDENGSVVGVLGVFWDVTERRKAEGERARLHAEMEVRAITDSLTNLYNHAYFYQRLAEEIDRSKRYNHGFAVVMMDVDDFKRYNDSRGHQAGDEMLRLVADCIRAGLRSSDIAFRYGGDEFATILPHANAAKARAAVERINRRITKSLKQVDGGSAVRLSLSAGVVCFPDDGTAGDDLVRIADAALYSAKWVARARDIIGQREDIQSLISALVSRRSGVEAPAGGAIVLRPEALHEQQARIVSSVASSIAVALKDAGVSQALEDPDLQVLATVGAAAEIKDRYIRGHPERTSEVAAALAGEMGLSPERVRDIRIAGLLHDIGKVTVSESVLNKPGRLTKREFASIKDHPIVGASLVSQVKGFEQLIPIVRHHHERFDGTGYPDSLTGEEIPLEARIMSVVDVFDAMTHERSYRKALSREQAIAELETGAGSQFDPQLVEAFLRVFRREEEKLLSSRERTRKETSLSRG